MTRKRVLLAIAAVAWLYAGLALANGVQGMCCQNGIPQVPQGQQCVILHQVGPGENLHILAAYYYGDARAWQRIYNFNRKTIRNPNNIKAGQVLRIEVPPCWTPRFDLQEFIRIEEARAAVLKTSTGEPARIHRTKETVEPKVNLEVETEEGSTAAPAGNQPRRPAPTGVTNPGAPASAAPVTVETEE